MEIKLGQVENYNPTTVNVWPFKKAEDIVNGINLRLSNMCGGYDFDALGRHWKSSEQLYLCGEFTDSQIQKELDEATSGYGAKRFIKAKYKDQVRPDFPTYRLQWMLWCVWQKCKGSKAFCDLLLSTGDGILVEDTTTDNGGTANIWGCGNLELTKTRREFESQYRANNPKAKGTTKQEYEKTINILRNRIQVVGVWVGENNIGKILMLCREALKSNTEPEIDYDLLNKSNITIFGQTVKFTNTK